MKYCKTIWISYFPGNFLHLSLWTLLMCSGTPINIHIWVTRQESYLWNLFNLGDSNYAVNVKFWGYKLNSSFTVCWKHSFGSQQQYLLLFYVFCSSDQMMWMYSMGLWGLQIGHSSDSMKILYFSLLTVCVFLSVSHAHISD